MAFGAEVCSTGALVTDPTELSYSGEGRARCTFSIVVGRTWVNRKTQQEESNMADFVVVCWGSLAENAYQSLRKGDRVVVTGRLEQVTFQDAHRDEHVREELLANDVGPGCWNQTVRVTKNPRRDAEGQAPPARTATQAKAANRGTAAHQRATASQRSYDDDEPF